MIYKGSKIPSEAILKKYGLTEEAWKSIWDRQSNACPICRKVPTTGRTYVDHEHVKGWKKMDDITRSSYVRGILCYVCNRFYLAKGMTRQKAENIKRYLISYMYGAFKDEY